MPSNSLTLCAATRRRVAVVAGYYAIITMFQSLSFGHFPASLGRLSITSILRHYRVSLAVEAFSVLRIWRLDITTEIEDSTGILWQRRMIRTELIGYRSIVPRSYFFIYSTWMPAGGRFHTRAFGSVPLYQSGITVTLQMPRIWPPGLLEVEHCFSE